LNDSSRVELKASDRKEPENNAGELFYASYHPFYDDTDTGLAGGLLELGQGQNVLWTLRHPNTTSGVLPCAVIGLPSEVSFPPVPRRGSRYVWAVVQPL